MIDPKTNPAPSTNQPKRELREVLISKTKVPDYARPLSLRNVQRIAKSLSAVGQIQPVLLIPSGDEFLIVSGVHRVHALASINQKSVRAELLPAETSVAQQMVISQQENQVRQNETLTETLDRIDRLVREANCTAKQAAEAAMVSEATLSKINTINDLLCERAMALIAEHRIGISIAYEVAKRANSERQQVEWLMAHAQGKLTRKDIVEASQPAKSPSPKLKLSFDLDGIVVCLTSSSAVAESTYDQIEEALKNALHQVKRQRGNGIPVDLLPRMLEASE